MFLPLGTDRAKRRPVAVTYALIAVNVAVFAVTVLLEQSNPDLYDRVWGWLVLVPDRSPWWTYGTYSLLHADYGHILFNSLFLWVFGPDVEDRLGRVGFLVLYVAGAVAGGVAYGLIPTGSGAVGMVGASGAIAAVTGSFLVFFPYVRVRTLVFFFFIGIFPITAWWYIAFAIASDLLGLAGGSRGGVAHVAHLGGYVIGAGISMILLWFKLVPREPYDLFTIGRQAARRRAFKAAYAAGTRQPGASSLPRSIERKEHEPEVRKPDGPAAQARLRAQKLIAEGDTAGAAEAYLEMRRLPDGLKLPVLGRRQLYEIANALFQAGDYANAADAYNEFLKAHGRDAEAGRVLLMLGLINARFLNDPTAAKRALNGAKKKQLSEADAALVDELLDEIE